MAKHTKTQKMGYALRINRTGETGSDSWERVGFLFQTRNEAAQYKEKHYAAVKKYTITGVRVNVEPISREAFYDRKQ